MTQAIATKTESIARPLRVLVPLIQADLKHGKEAAEKASMPYYQAAGEKLIEARGQMKHGEFIPWVRRNFNLGTSQASLYMKYAETIQSSAAGGTFSTLRAFRRSIEPGAGSGSASPSWHEPVKQIVERVDTETLNLKRDELKRAEERDAQRELALRLIEIGYKVLARTLHPDKGGSREAMIRLNAVRDRLKLHA